MTDDSTTGRRRFLVGSTSVVGAAGVAGALIPFIGSWNPSAVSQTADKSLGAVVSRCALCAHRTHG